MEKLEITLYSAQKVESIPDNIEYVLSGVYLHGKIEYNVGYDILYTTKDALDTITNLPENTYSINVKDAGNDVLYEDCTLYLWHSDIFKNRGLVCFKDDKDANKFAVEKYNNRIIFI